MSVLECKPGEAFSAYFVVRLFDDIEYQLYPQGLQESNRARGMGLYCTLNLADAEASGKDVIVVEFVPTLVEATCGCNDLLVEIDGTDGHRWRQRGYSGLLFTPVSLCIRSECIRALYRREWRFV